MKTDDTLFEIDTAEVDMLVEIATIIGAQGSCRVGVVCPTWDRVRTLVTLTDTRKMVVVNRGLVRLTPLGCEWAEAFTRNSMRIVTEERPS